MSIAVKVKVLSVIELLAPSFLSLSSYWNSLLGNVGDVMVTDHDTASRESSSHVSPYFEIVIIAAL
jgi:hypothetical protein